MCFSCFIHNNIKKQGLFSCSWSPFMLFCVDTKCGNPSCSHLHRCYQPNSTSQSPRLWYNHSSQGETCGANLEGDLYFPEATYWLITAWSVQLFFFFTVTVNHKGDGFYFNGNRSVVSSCPCLLININNLKIKRRNMVQRKFAFR